MHPADFFQSLQSEEQLQDVFVMMPFGPEHTWFWSSVVEPSIHALGPGRFTPTRTDLALHAGSALTEIFDRIARSALLVADITATLGPDGRPFRNDNVMYELGIAHAIRQSQDVVVIRRDRSPLNFDLANTVVHDIDTADPGRAAEQMTGLMRRALASANYENSLRVTRAIRRLDAFARALLLKSKGAVVYISRNQHEADWDETVADVLRVHYTSVLMDAQIAELAGSQFVNSTLMRLTPFGEAVVKRLRDAGPGSD